MKKQYILLIMIGVILYIGYLIISFKYKEYQITSHIRFIENINTQMKQDIKTGLGIIEYKSTKAYKNKIQKEQFSLKNKGEHVIFLTSQEVYQKYAENEFTPVEKIIIPNTEESYIETMSIFEKWIYLVFKKDIR